MIGFSFSSLPGFDASCSSIRMGELFSYFSGFGHCPEVVSYEQDSLLLTFNSGYNETVQGVYSCGGGGSGGSGGRGGCCWLWSCFGWGQSSGSQDVSGGGELGAGGGAGGGDEDRPVDYVRGGPSDTASLRDQLIEKLKKILRSSGQFKEYRFENLANALAKHPFNLTPDPAVISWATGLSKVSDQRILSADSHQ